MYMYKKRLKGNIYVTVCITYNASETMLEVVCDRTVQKEESLYFYIWFSPVMIWWLKCIKHQRIDEN